MEQVRRGRVMVEAAKHYETFTFFLTSYNHHTAIFIDLHPHPLSTMLLAMLCRLGFNITDVLHHLISKIPHLSTQYRTGTTPVWMIPAQPAVCRHTFFAG